jgi:esterase/lipase superfamily enzyme
MRVRYALLAVLLILWWSAAASAREPDYLVSSAFTALQSGDLTIFGRHLQARLRREASSYRDQIRRVGELESVAVTGEQTLPNGILVTAITSHPHGELEWKVGYSGQTQKIEILTVRRARAMRPQLDRLGLAPVAAATCRQYQALCAPKDSQTVEFLFATARKRVSGEPARFSGERGELVYGAARVRVPEGHHIGRIELPGYALWSLGIYERKADEKKHFVIRSTVQLSEDDWKDYIGGLEANEALVFVHGYNTSFEDALYRNAQIIFDLKYKRGISVLFTWASNGGPLDYLYDTNSALNARASFLQVLRHLRSAGIEKIHVLAHSMGNLVVLEALAGEARTADPLNIAQLIMAAPDVDWNAFKHLGPEVRRITQGMTLYASSADKAMDVSRVLAKVPRAGDVTAAGPMVLPDIDTIDVTAVGHELFGLNHDIFAAGRSVLSDVSRIILDGLRPPDARLPVEIQPMPEGASPPKFWRYRE